MRKILLPFFALAAMVSQAWGALCLANGEVVLCEWDTGKCWQLNSTGSDGPSTCATQAGHCPKLYMGSEESNGSCSGKTLFTNCETCYTEQGGLVWCDYGGPSEYGDGGCYEKTATECTANSGASVTKEQCDARNAGNGGPNPGGDTGGGCTHQYGSSPKCCMYNNDPNNCWGIDGPNDKDDGVLQTSATCVANSGKVVNSCSEVDANAKYCNWGACLEPSGYSCTGGGGCYLLPTATHATPADCEADYGTVVTVCPAGTTPETAGQGGGSCTNGATNYPACNNNQEQGDYCTNNYYAQGCPGYTGAPIITIKTPFSGNALTAMQNAVNLQVKGTATLRIYDMKGNAIRTQKVEQGNHVVQLQLPRGLYIIKATSGSWKQTVKATVK